jgi:excisionase family DNA binding protein
MTDELLTPRQVAELLQVDRNSIYRWIKKGVINAIKLPGGQIRFNRNYINRLVENGIPSTPEEPDRGI